MIRRTLPVLLLLLLGAAFAVHVHADRPPVAVPVPPGGERDDIPIADAVPVAQTFVGGRAQSQQPPEATYTEVTHESWVAGVGNSIIVSIFGCVLSCLAPALLFWNEGRAVRKSKLLRTLAHSVRSVDKLDSQNDGCVIYSKGRAVLHAKDSKVQDPRFRLPKNGGACILALRRNVEMLQWKQEKHTDRQKRAGGSVVKTTRYTYKKVWSSKAIPSGNFNQQQYVNPPMEFESETWFCNSGIDFLPAGTSVEHKFRMHHDLQKQLKFDTTYTPDAEDRQNGQWEGVHMLRGQDIGAYRIKWTMAKPQDIAVVAQQSGNELITWNSPDGNGTICWLQPGHASLAEMQAQFQSNNTMETWCLRIAGYVIWSVALMMVAQPLERILDVATIPFIGLEPGTIVGWISGALAWIVSLALSLLVIAVAWLFYRPAHAVVLLASAAALYFFVLQPNSVASSHLHPASSSSANAPGCPGGTMSRCTQYCDSLSGEAFRSCVRDCASNCS